MSNPNFDLRSTGAKVSKAVSCLNQSTTYHLTDLMMVLRVTSNLVLGRLHLLRLVVPLFWRSYFIFVSCSSVCWSSLGDASKSSGSRLVSSKDSLWEVIECSLRCSSTFENARVVWSPSDIVSLIWDEGQVTPSSFFLKSPCLDRCIWLGTKSFRSVCSSSLTWTLQSELSLSFYGFPLKIC